MSGMAQASVAVGQGRSESKGWSESGLTRSQMRQLAPGLRSIRIIKVTRDEIEAESENGAGLHGHVRIQIVGNVATVLLGPADIFEIAWLFGLGQHGVVESSTAEDLQVRLIRLVAMAGTIAGVSGV